MIEINKITELDDKRHIALLDTTSISFMQGLSVKGLQPEVICVSILEKQIRLIWMNIKTG